VRIAVDNGKPVRIGVNWGSLDQDLLTQMMDENARRPEPHDAKDVYIEAMLESALRSAALAEETGLGHDQILISAKVSVVQDLVAVMGCFVNGPGEWKHANIGISLPGTFEDPKAPVYVDGKLVVTLRGENIVPEFLEILERYVERKYPAAVAVES